MSWALRVRGLSVSIGGVRVVEGVDLEVPRGGTLAVVGESGSGKSVTALAVMGLLPGGARVEAGVIELADRHAVGGGGDGGGGVGAVDLLGLSERAMRRVRGGSIGMVFQEPMTSLNPVMRVGEQVAEVVRAHRGRGGGVERGGGRGGWWGGWGWAWREAVAGLAAVGIAEPGRAARSYPHRLSGGMRQRAVIAGALAGGPWVLIADEPTTALDESTRGVVLDVITGAQRARGLSVMLITHDLSLVRGRADRVAVMCGGRVVESGPARAVLGESPGESGSGGGVHPYTAGLLGCGIGPGTEPGSRLGVMERGAGWSAGALGLLGAGGGCGEDGPGVGETGVGGPCVCGPWWPGAQGALTPGRAVTIGPGHWVLASSRIGA